MEGCEQIKIEGKNNTFKNMRKYNYTSIRRHQNWTNFNNLNELQRWTVKRRKWHIPHANFMLQQLTTFIHIQSYG